MNDQPRLRTTHIADAADAMRLGDIGAGGFEFLGTSDTLAIGKAFTVRQQPTSNADDKAAATARHGEAATALSHPGEILVIQVDGQTEGATWGEAWTLRAMSRGLSGILIDGKTRDRAALQHRGFPILCRGASPLRSKGRMMTVAMEADLVIAGVRVRHGDTIAMDCDGFVCIPAEFAESVLEEAQAIALREEERDRGLEAQLKS